ncbi:MAG: AmmeMemoRadiSam system protein A [Candidatus Micrarchaeota archaeon]
MAIALHPANAQKLPERRAFRVIGGLVEDNPQRIDFIGRRYLLALARMSVEGHFSGEIPDVKLWEAPVQEVSEVKACFVTINSSGNLRGCIGSLHAFRPLMHDVMENAINAAFHDERFPPLAERELGAINFSISVIDEPSGLAVRSADELLSKLVEAKHGLIIRKGGAMATYLPHVWRMFPEKEEFLKNLCLKAGLPGDEWRGQGMEFFTYEAQEFSE